jgi:hypothetical protein
VAASSLRGPGSGSTCALAPASQLGSALFTQNGGLGASCPVGTDLPRPRQRMGAGGARRPGACLPGLGGGEGRGGGHVAVFISSWRAAPPSLASVVPSCALPCVRAAVGGGPGRSPSSSTGLGCSSASRRFPYLLGFLRPRCWRSVYSSPRAPGCRGARHGWGPTGRDAVQSLRLSATPHRAGSGPSASPDPDTLDPGRPRWCSSHVPRPGHAGSAPLPGMSQPVGNPTLTCDGLGGRQWPRVELSSSEADQKLPAQ